MTFCLWGLFACVVQAIDAAALVVADEQGAIKGDDDINRPAPSASPQSLP